MTTHVDDLRAELARAQAEGRDLKARLAIAEGERDEARAAMRGWQDAAADATTLRVRAVARAEAAEGERDAFFAQTEELTRALRDAQHDRDRARSFLAHATERLNRELRDHDAEVRALTAERDALRARADDAERVVVDLRDDLRTLRAAVWDALGYAHTARSGDPAPEVAAEVAERRRLDALAATACDERRAAEAERDALRDQLRHARARAADAAETERLAEERRGKVLELMSERDALRAIIEGRTVPPSLPERRIHADAGGAWLVTVPERSADGPRGRVRFPAHTRYVESEDDAAVIFWTSGARWVPTLDGRPTAWPVAPEVPCG